MNLQQQAINQKIVKAESLLAEVPVLMEHQFYTTAINRLYYACFHATKALLLTKSLTPKTHSGVINLLHQHFVQSGIVDAQQAAFFSKLLHERIEDDYSDALIMDEEEVLEFIEPAKEYVNYIEKLVENYQTT